jgi:Na+/H+ antiporter NhaC
MSNVTAVVAEAAAGGGEHSSQISPYAFGGFALVVLLLLLWITTRINIDR